jgi:hypothetical protein
MPELVELHREWNSRGVRVVAACLDAEDRSPAELQAFLAEHHIDLPVLAMAGDWGPVADHFGFLGPPSTRLIGPGGSILERHDGRIDRESVERALAARR